MHEGINTDLVRPNPAAVFGTQDQGRAFHAGDEVITFVNRNLEPMRGFHIFMRALPQILAARPSAQVVIVGGDGVSYGLPPPEGQTWRSHILKEVGDQLPLDRLHFVGNIPYRDFIALMQVSRLHVYLTYPFVLSWSMLEAMSAGALVLGSSTTPVRDVLEDAKNGLLFDFFDVKGLAERAIEMLSQPELFSDLRLTARQTIVEKYDLRRVCLPKWLSVVQDVATARAT